MYCIDDAEVAGDYIVVDSDDSDDSAYEDDDLNMDDINIDDINMKELSPEFVPVSTIKWCRVRNRKPYELFIIWLDSEAPVYSGRDYRITR